MLNRWLDPLEWERVRPVLIALGSLLVGSAKVSEIRRNDSWTVAFDWLILGACVLVVLGSLREIWRLERAAHSRKRTDGTP